MFVNRDAAMTREAYIRYGIVFNRANCISVEWKLKTDCGLT